jgi:hypothetical protein
MLPTIILSMLIIVVNEENYCTLEQHFKQFTDDANKLLVNTKFFNTNEINDSLDITIKFCSDGGVKHDVSGFGIVASINNIIILKNKQRLISTYNKFTSHRSEAIGMLSAINTMYAINSFLKKKRNTIRINAILLCDNESVIKTLTKFKTKKTVIKDYYTADFDVLDAIIRRWKLLQRNGTNIQFIYVRGHQDRNNLTLSENAKLNIVADTLATEAMKLKTIKNHHSYLSDASMVINNQLVTNNFKKSLRDNYLSMNLRDYLISANNWKKK